MQRSIEYASAPSPTSDVLSASDQVYLVATEVQRKRVGAPPGAMPILTIIEENNHPSFKVCFLPHCTIGLTVVLLLSNLPYNINFCG